LKETTMTDTYTVVREDTSHYAHVISHHLTLTAAECAAKRHESRSRGAHRVYDVIVVERRHAIGSRIRTS